MVVRLETLHFDNILSIETLLSGTEALLQDAEELWRTETVIAATGKTL
jgi:hypothetical protein